MDFSNQRILIIGAAGFIGASVYSRIASKCPHTRGIDNFSEYYDSRIKLSHLESLGLNAKVSKIDICDLKALQNLYSEFKPDVVVHLAAQGGVRASQVDPEPYIQTNQMGFLNLLNLNNDFQVKTFIYASSSSVYGEGLPTPFRENMQLPGPKSLYAASKVANEIMAEHFPRSKDHRRVGLRFFTVYGPWGRPDMAVSRLLSSGYKKRPFVLTANLDLVRDFTFVEDVTDVIEDLLATNLELQSNHLLVNVAGESPRTMSELIQICQAESFPINIEIGEINKLDVTKTHGSSQRLKELGLRTPKTTLEDGISLTAKWFSGFSKSELFEKLV